MNDTASSPSRLLQITAVTARWLLGLLFAAWLLLALSVVVLHAWIVPRIGDFRGALEAQASKAIGVPVRIGAITARSEGLFPAFELRDVVLQDADQREALRLVRVVASVSPRSLWRLNFEQLYIEGPQLDVRRDTQENSMWLDCTWRPTRPEKPAPPTGFSRSASSSSKAAPCAGPTSSAAPNRCC